MKKIKERGSKKGLILQIKIKKKKVKRLTHNLKTIATKLVSPVRNWMYAIFVKSTTRIPPEMLMPAKIPRAIDKIDKMIKTIK